MDDVIFNVAQALKTAKLEEGLDRPLAVKQVAKKTLALRMLSKYPKIFSEIAKELRFHPDGPRYCLKIVYSTYYELRERYEKGVIADLDLYLFLGEEAVNLYKAADVYKADVNFCKTMHRFAMWGVFAVVGMDERDWQNARKVHHLGKCFLKHEKNRELCRKWKDDDDFIRNQIRKSRRW